jgi:hypothetical protein
LVRFIGERDMLEHPPDLQVLANLVICWSVACSVYLNFITLLSGVYQSMLV